MSIYVYVAFGYMNRVEHDVASVVSTSREQCKCCVGHVAPAGDSIQRSLPIVITSDDARSDHSVCVWMISEFIFKAHRIF